MLTTLFATHTTGDTSMFAGLSNDFWTELGARSLVLLIGFLFVACFWLLFDVIFLKRMDFQDEIVKGNKGAAILASAVLIGAVWFVVSVLS